jgi:hypothetical protein
MLRSILAEAARVWIGEAFARHIGTMNSGTNVAVRGVER